MVPLYYDVCMLHVLGFNSQDTLLLTTFVFQIILYYYIKGRNSVKEENNVELIYYYIYIYCIAAFIVSE